MPLCSIRPFVLPKAIVRRLLIACFYVFVFACFFFSSTLQPKTANAGCIASSAECQREQQVCLRNGVSCPPREEGFRNCLCSTQWVTIGDAVCGHDAWGCDNGIPRCSNSGDRAVGVCGSYDGPTPTPPPPTSADTGTPPGGNNCYITELQAHCGGRCSDSRDAAACALGGETINYFTSCCVASCDESCPARNCPGTSLWQGTTNKLVGNSCIPNGNTCPASRGPYSQTIPADITNVCGGYLQLNFNACADVTKPLDVPPNSTQENKCNELLACPTNTCGGSICCSKCESCGNLIIRGNVLERTGYDVGGAFAYHTPLQSFRNLRVGGDLSQSDHPLCGDMTCTIDGVNHYTCTVSLPDGCSRTGSVDIVVQGDGYDNHTESVTYTNVLQGGATIDKNLSLVYQVPTNESPGNWTQVRGASYTPRGSGASTQTIVNVMPIAPTRYDTTDAVPTLTNYGFNTGTDANGAVTSNAFLGNYTKYSVDRDWHIDGYPMASRDVTSVYLQYVTKRKLTAYVANSYPRGSVILVPGGTTIPAITDLSFTGAVADGGVLFLVGTSGTPGAVTLSGNITTTTAVGIIAGGITVSPAVSEIDGVFAANIFDTGATTDQGLKIVGNLTAVQTFTNNRKWQDTSRPSVYVQYDIGRQLGLLKNLSIATSTSQQEE